MLESIKLNDSPLILSKLEEPTFKLDLQSIKLDHLQNVPNVIDDNQSEMKDLEALLIH